MAARQDQGLQIALIAFVFLFVVCAAMSYLFYKSSSDAKAQVVQLNSDLKTARDNEAKQRGDSTEFRQMIGVGEVDNPKDISDTFAEDMKKYGSTFDTSQQNYRAILAAVYNENEKIAAREVAAKDSLKEAHEHLLAVEAQKEKQVVDYQNEMKKAQEDAAGERNRFEQDRKDLENKKRELSDALDKQRARYEGQISDIDTKLKELTDKLSKSEKAKQNLMAQVSKSSESFEVPDGRVAYVTQNGTVWVNLGSADSLRRQITFSVFEPNERDPMKAEKKGSLEVTRILGEHLAEARITEDDATNPILTGDQIYSQVWHRGKMLRFALTGVIDIDGDGRSELQLVRDLITLNGGVVDAYVTDDGKVEGEITVNTRYLVLGKYPEEPIQTAMQKGWAVMNDDAKTNGVETITLDKFLNEIGYAPGDRIVTLGAGARASDFATSPEPQPGLPPDATRNTKEFRPRSPNRPLPAAP